MLKFSWYIEEIFQYRYNSIGADSETQEKCYAYRAKVDVFFSGKRVTMLFKFRFLGGRGKYEIQQWIIEQTIQPDDIQSLGYQE